MTLHRLWAVVQADVRIRMRRPSTAVVFVLLSMIPYMWIPDPSTGRALIQVGGSRALYNSAAIGMATAMLGTMFIGLFGFYIISNALRRDVLSRCGYVIASTTMRGSEYIVGKFAGNVAFLSLFTLGYMATAMAMVIVRGEAPLQPWLFAKQYLLLVPPAIVFVSATAILFECTPLLRTKLGDVAYFFLWLGLMGSVVGMLETGGVGQWITYFDVSGFGFMFQQMQVYYDTKSLSIGASSFDAAKPPFAFAGLRMSWQWLLPRLGSTLFPLSFLVLARVFFHRFDPPRVRAVPNEKTRRSWIGRFNLLAKPFARLVVAVLTPFSRTAAMRDALMTIASFPLLSLAIVGFAIAALASDALFTGVLPIAFAACAIALADIACREKRAGTTALVFAAPGLRTRFVLFKFTSTLVVALAFLGIPVARAILTRPTSALPLLVGILFITAAATALGILSANPKTFIVGFLTFWYVALSDKGASPELDFAGLFGKATSAVTLSYALLALLFLATAHAYHLHELRRKW